MDLASWDRWGEYSKAKDQMLSHNLISLDALKLHILFCLLLECLFAFHRIWGWSLNASELTNIPEAPWFNVEANDKKRARLNCIHHILSKIP